MMQFATTGLRWIRSNQAGVCLPEVLVSLVMGAVVLAGSLEAMNVVHAQAVRQYRAMASQQDVRLGLEVFAQEVKLASASGITSASADQLEFTANLHGLRTVTTGAVMTGQTVISVQDGSDWGVGKIVELCGANGCESHQLARQGQRGQLVFTEPVRNLYPAGASVEMRNRVSYYVRLDEQGQMQLMRRVDGVSGVLIGPLQSLRLSYWDAHGRIAGGGTAIARVVMTISNGDANGGTAWEVSLRS
ncbi:MAG: hypothetical protein U0412_09185 [Nitrospira sp.]